MDAVIFRFSCADLYCSAFIFLASDPQTLPFTNGGRVLYGIALGVITVIFRNSANIEGIFVFSADSKRLCRCILDKLAFVIGVQTKQQLLRYLLGITSARLSE